MFFLFINEAVFHSSSRNVKCILAVCKSILWPVFFVLSWCCAVFQTYHAVFFGSNGPLFCVHITFCESGVKVFNPWNWSSQRPINSTHFSWVIGSRLVEVDWTGVFTISFIRTDIWTGLSQPADTRGGSQGCSLFVQSLLTLKVNC